jgi:diaminopropionate ammonia-lyase
MLIDHFHNVNKSSKPYAEELQSVLSLKNTHEAFDEIVSWRGYEVTPLLSLEEISSQINVKKIFYKDESTRFGLGSFKALGGTYGVLKFLHDMLMQEINTNVTLEDIRSGKFKEIVSRYTVSTATDGNHGRSVAFGANLFGCKCQIYIHSEVSMGRQKALEELNANVTRVNGNYDDSVNICKSESNLNNWHIISDTSYPGYTKYPKDIMAGYNVMSEEISNQLEKEEMPTHIFLQGGVGSFPAAICSYFWEKYHENNIKFIVVESEHAPCLIKSAKESQMVSVAIKKETMMAGLSCGKPSLLGWNILEKGADDFVTISDQPIPLLMRLLADNNPPIEAGESSVAGLAALIEITKSPQIAEKIGLNSESIILLFGTEGATDPEIYNSIIQAN